VSQPRFFAVDFFCGAGGTTRGLIDAGGYVIAGVDKTGDCRETYERNNTNKSLIKANARYLQMDIFDRTEAYPDGQADELIRELHSMIDFYRLRNPEIPLLFSICAPCQPFTDLHRSELSDDRSASRERDQGLLNQTFEFIQEFKPEMVLSENVAGIQAPKFGGVWQEFESRLRAAGYAVGSNIVDCSRFGIPQFRKRSIMLGVHKTMCDPQLIANDGSANDYLIVPGGDPDSSVMTVKEAIGHFPPIEAGESNSKIANHTAAKLAEINKKRLKAVVPGGTNLGFDEELTLACHDRTRSKSCAKGFSDVYTRMSPDKPAPTITTKCISISNGRFGHFDPEQARGISVREAAALQSFPDDYVFYGGLCASAKMVGNAVPPKLSQFFANYLMSALASDNTPVAMQHCEDLAA